MTDYVDLFIEDQIQHHGIKGMKWGVIRKRGSSGPTSVSVNTKPGQKVKAKGGSGQAPHEDAIAAVSLRQVAKKSSTHALSNDDLGKLVKRMQLEANYSKLAAQDDQRSPAQKFIAGLLKTEGQAALSGSKGPATIAIGKAIVSAKARRAA